MFEAGAFSARPGDPLRADASALESLADEAVAAGFQASDANPLAGIAGRADLLRRLGRTVAAAPKIFATADAPRPGGLFDHLAALADHRRIEAPTILRELLLHLGPIWPSRITLGGIALGDCWRHPAIRRDDPTDQLVPFHKLSQWLAYSLIEPLEAAGIAVTNVDGLTGLAEYRNGGLFVDIRGSDLPRRRRRRARAPRGLAAGGRLAFTHRRPARPPGWARSRAARTRRGEPAARPHPARRHLERRTVLAARLRPDGGPPVAIVSDGTVF